MTGASRTEVCVIGGGPAGSSVALHLARLGHEVTLIERAAFPRPQIGEALAPSIWPVLDLLGLRDAVEAADFARSERAILAWTGDRDELLERPAGQFGLNVDRGRFDRLIVEAAGRAGVRVLQPARAGKPRQIAEGWIVPVEAAGGEAAVQCRFLVDAAGRHSNIRRTPPPGAPETVALYGHWAGTSLVPGPSRIEAGEDAWYWGAPRPDGSFCAMVFVARRRGAGPTIETEYRARLARSSLLARCLEGTLAEKVRLRDATARRSDECVADTVLKVGEASFALDPLSSQGVQAAMTSGVQASVVIHTMRTYPDDAEHAMAFYRASQRDGFARHRRFVARLYAAPRRFAGNPFWQARAAGAATAEPLPGAPSAQNDRSALRLDRPLRLSADARIVPTPVIEGDRIRMRRALLHPALERPVAYLEGLALAPLLERAAGEPPAIVAAWAADLPPQQAWRVLSWLTACRILEPVPAL